MKYKTVIDENREEEVLIYAHERTPLVDSIEQLLEADSCSLLGYIEREAVRLDPNEVYCFTVEDGKVYAVCEKERLQMRLRLYRLEEKLSGGFVRINQSCIANISKIERFSARISGTLEVIFKNGHSDYVSRRQLKEVKERLGL